MTVIVLKDSFMVIIEYIKRNVQVRKILIVVGLVTILCCCNLGRIDEVNRDYLNELRQYPKFLVSHFPSKIETLPIINRTITDTTSDCILYMLIEKIDDKAYHIRDSLNKIKLKSYTANDSNLVTIKTEGLLGWHPEKIVYYRSLSRGSQFYYPIPYFESIKQNSMVKDVFSCSTISGLAGDIVIYIVDSKSGKFWTGLRPNKYMPVGWKNGYSKGVSLSPKMGIIIYWFVVW